MSGRHFSCALTNGGAVHRWGDNTFGELGDGTTNYGYHPVTVVGLSGSATSLSAGFYYSCATLSNGGIQCWGYNFCGQLGNGTSGGSCNSPMEVVGLTGGVQAVDTGNRHTCARTDLGALKCWGWNGSGQLGLGTLPKSLTPVDLLAAVDPLLTRNYLTGQPGSFFALTGQHFPPGSFVYAGSPGPVEPHGGRGPGAFGAWRYRGV